MGAFNKCYYFTSPIGSCNADGTVKTQWHTNLTQSGCLGFPQEFDLERFSIEMISGDLEDVKGYVAKGLFQFFFGQNRAWFTYPVHTMNPSLFCFLHDNPGKWIETESSSQVEDILKYIAEQRLKGEMPDRATISSMVGGYIRPGVDADSGKRPIKILSGEIFQCTVEFPDEALETRGHLVTRVLMEGTLYTAL